MVNKAYLISIFEKVLQDIYNAKTYIDAKNIIINCLEKSHINKEDDYRIKDTIEHIESQYGTEGKISLHKLQLFMTNLIFKYKGMGANIRRKYR